MISAGWREAIEELSRRKLRTLLTLLGMIFGVGAIVAMQGVGEGSRREALKLVDSLGLHNLIVEAKSQDGDALKETRARSLGLTVADARAALDVVPSAERYAEVPAVASECDPAWIDRFDRKRLAEGAAGAESVGVHAPLAGVPVAVKGNIDVAGLPTTAACPSFSERDAAQHATAVQRLADAGAVIP